MAKKDDSLLQKSIGVLSSLFFDSAFSKVEKETDNLLGKVEDKAEKILEHAEARLVRVQKQFIEGMTVSIFMAISGAFLLLTAYVYMIDSMGFARAKAALYVAIAMFIIGFGFKYHYLQRGNT